MTAPIVITRKQAVTAVMVAIYAVVLVVASWQIYVQSRYIACEKHRSNVLELRDQLYARGGGVGNAQEQWARIITENPAPVC